MCMCLGGGKRGMGRKGLGFWHLHMYDSPCRKKKKKKKRTVLRTVCSYCPDAFMCFSEKKRKRRKKRIACRQDHRPPSTYIPGFLICEVVGGDGGGGGIRRGEVFRWFEMGGGGAIKCRALFLPPPPKWKLHSYLTSPSLSLFFFVIGGAFFLKKSFVCMCVCDNRMKGTFLLFCSKR